MVFNFLIRRATLLFFVALLIGGASNQVTVTFVSNPPGAILVQAGQKFGRMPFKLTFNIPLADQQKEGVWIAQGRYEWPDGTVTKFSKFYLDLRKKNYFTYTLNQGPSERDKKLALEKCNRAIGDIQNMCRRGTSSYNRYNCSLANSNAQTFCYDSVLRDRRCDIARALSRVACPNKNFAGGLGNSSFYTCSQSSSDVGICLSKGR